MQTSTPVASRDEHDLVAAARDGDDRAFEELYSRYRERITAYVRGMVRDYGRAEDIMQEVFISALRRLRETDRAIAFKPWLYEIAKNACIDEHRRNLRSREVPTAIEDELPGSAVSLRSAMPAPEEAVERKQRLADLRGAFGGLSETHHKVLVMRELEGLSYEQIGERLEMTLPMVESTLFRARRKLGEEYRELTSGRRCEQVLLAIDTAGPGALRSFGVRRRRQLARHLAHCQPCRHTALMAGWDESELRPRSLAEKVAALLPFPLLRLRRGAGSRPSSSSTLGAHGMFQSLAGSSDSLSSLGLGRGAAALAALALAGAGGGVVAASGHSSSPAVPARPAALSRALPAAPTPAAVAAPVLTARPASGEPTPTKSASERRSHPRASRADRRGTGAQPPSAGGAAAPAAGSSQSSPAASSSASGGSGPTPTKLTAKVPGTSPGLPVPTAGSGSGGSSPLPAPPSLQAPKLPPLPLPSPPGSGGSNGASSGSQLPSVSHIGLP